MTRDPLCILPALGAMDHFREVLAGTTVPAVGGGRMIRGSLQALALSAPTSVLHGALSAAQLAVVSVHGVATMRGAPGLILGESDSPEGPFTPVPWEDLERYEVPVGAGGADPLLLAALESALEITAVPPDRWNAGQLQRPGALHQRWRAGDVITDESLAVLESAAKMLRLCAPAADAEVEAKQERHPESGETDDFVTLDQAAAISCRSKRTLEDYLTAGKLPRPDFPGGGGRASVWRWSSLRPALQKCVARPLPEKYPASRAIV